MTSVQNALARRIRDWLVEFSVETRNPGFVGDRLAKMATDTLLPGAAGMEWFEGWRASYCQ